MISSSRVWLAPTVILTCVRLMIELAKKKEIVDCIEEKYSTVAAEKSITYLSDDGFAKT